jgi:hypothetical protein
LNALVIIQSVRCHIPFLLLRRRSLGFALRRLSHEKLVIDPVLLNQYVTLLFIGTISALSIRAFLKNASRVFSTLTHVRGWFRVGSFSSSSSAGAGAAGASSGSGRGLSGLGRGRQSSVASGPGGAAGGAGANTGASLVLMLSELTGVYSISSLLLIRRNVPVKYRAAIDGVLGGELEFQYFHR